MKPKPTALILITLLLFQPARSQVDQLMEQRSRTPDIQQVLNGSLRFLADRQMAFQGISGMWPAKIHPLPKKRPDKPLSGYFKPDYCHFIPISIAYPLMLVDESDLPEEAQLVTPMIAELWTISAAFKRGHSYNFWLPDPDDPKVYGPSLIHMEFMEQRMLAANTLSGRLFWKFLQKNLHPNDFPWFKTVMDPDQNPTGASAFFNIPGDADDTALALAFQVYRKQLGLRHPNHPVFGQSANNMEDQEAIRQLIRFRDTLATVTHYDSWQNWKEPQSGAFLTWHKPFDENTFADPNDGIIPYGQNNVDGVVNANVLFALGLTGQVYPGMQASTRLLIQIIENQHWPECGLYYPQLMMFPYTASRAFRDGNIQELQPAMKILMKQVLAMGTVYQQEMGGRPGAFPGGEDLTDHLSTALALCTLLNIGRDIAAETGLLERYDKALSQGIAYLIQSARKTKVQNHSGSAGYRWDPGIYFASSYWDTAHWRSEAFTAAMAAEALIKYLLAWDYGECTIQTGRRLRIDF